MPWNTVYNVSRNEDLVKSRGDISDYSISWEPTLASAHATFIILYCLNVLLINFIIQYTCFLFVVLSVNSQLSCILAVYLYETTAYTINIFCKATVKQVCVVCCIASYAVSLQLSSVVDWFLTDRCRCLLPWWQVHGPSLAERLLIAGYTRLLVGDCSMH